MNFNNPKSSTMTATNINVTEFIELLNKLISNGIKFIDMDMLPDENNPSMNKLVLYPLGTSPGNNIPKNNEQVNKFAIMNPSINTDNNDIFNSLNDLV